MLTLTKIYAVKTGQPRYKMFLNTLFSNKLRLAKLRIKKNLFAKKDVNFFRKVITKLIYKIFNL